MSVKGDRGRGFELLAIEGRKNANDIIRASGGLYNASTDARSADTVNFRSKEKHILLVYRFHELSDN